jgi:hypothetical protein
VPSLFRRKPADPVADPVDAPEPAEPARVKSYTPKKGEATPKRPVAGRRAVAANPVDSKEARALARQKRREDADERRRGMAEGDDQHVLPRDRGPVRRHVRDIVDSRRNVGSLFLFALVAMIGLSLSPVPVLRLASNLVLLGFILAVAVDGVFLSRRIKRLVGAKFPKHDEKWGALYRYGFIRATSIRKMRMPKPKVNVGDPV